MWNLYEENYKALWGIHNNLWTFGKTLFFKKYLIQTHIQNLEIPVSILTGSVWGIKENNGTEYMEEYICLKEKCNGREISPPTLRQWDYINIFLAWIDKEARTE